MIRVLLVDDQELVRSGFRIILESEPDIEVVGEAENGPDAVELAAALEPDVICMDVEMPGAFDGIEASRRILRDRRNPSSGRRPSAEREDAPGAVAARSDASHSGLPGIEASRRILDVGAAENAGAAGSRGTAILILTTFGHETYLFDALAAGVSGFLLKTSRAEQLIDAVRTLADGKALLGPDVTRAVIERISAERAGAGAGSTGAGAPGAGSTGAGAPGVGNTGASRSTGAAGGSAAAAPRGDSGSAAGSGAAAGSEAAFDAVGLTEREREVLRLVAEGRSNSEIAGELFLGEATVKTHVSNVLQKLGVRDRIQAVVWVHTHA